MVSVLVLSGSPSVMSRTASLGDFIARKLAQDGIATEHLMLRDLPSADLLSANVNAPEIAAAIEAIAAADGIVVVTPIYKAAYSGLTKIFLDLLPQFAMENKAIFPIATGGSLAHVLALDYALRPVLHSMKARHVVQSYFITDKSFQKCDAGYVCEEADLGPLFQTGFDDFRHSLRSFDQFRDADFGAAPAARIA